MSYVNLLVSKIDFDDQSISIALDVEHGAYPNQIGVREILP
jgi:hypothetical protein